MRLHGAEAGLGLGCVLVPAALALACLLAPAVHAEVFRCEGPDGRPLFTSDRSLCPSAVPHESHGRIQRVEPAPKAPPVPARRGPTAPVRPGSPDEEAERAVWQAKRENAEAELTRLRQQLDTLHGVAGWCNRGHEVWSTDQDGLRHDVDCDEVEAQEKALANASRRLEQYLAEGLEDECRRAGCLPGWVRD